jgi:hypothetical protein
MLRACMAAALIAALIASASTAAAQSSYIHPETGRDCVEPVRAYTETYTYSTSYFWVFTNICGRSFSIRGYPDYVDSSLRGQSIENGISPGSRERPSESRLVCMNNNDSRSCSGFTGEYEVR